MTETMVRETETEKGRKTATEERRTELKQRESYPVVLAQAEVMAGTVMLLLPLDP